MMTTRVVSSVSGRSASQSAADFALEDVMVRVTDPLSPQTVRRGRWEKDAHAASPR